MRPFRFGLAAARFNEPDKWLAFARRAEAAGYDCFMVPDHLGRLATFPALMAAAGATRSIKLATYVLNQDFRSPGLLAIEAASVQLLTGGRLQLGIGAGWARREYTQLGLQYDAARVRVSRFEEYLEVVRGLLHATTPFSYSGKFFTLDGCVPLEPRPDPPPPILVGGGSPRILGIAARLADIISVATRATADGRVDMPNISLAAVEDKVRRIREAAGDRFEQIELNVTMRELRLADDRRGAARELLNTWARAPGMANVDQLTEDDVLESPFIAIGTVDQIVEQFERARERWGFAFLEIYNSDFEVVGPIIERLNGR
ncbi:MAG: TIGR03621 family F420-dependent LLM class oxidoreductase [Chloroflexi bacterium]|nr:TIGR03621 family F420-dependent LLM class oxidoreductase [Chloroflexota bacterium]